MATVWITYSWNDNKTGDVDFLAQELRDAGLDVTLDRWTIVAGKRLWEQIEGFIQNKDSSDAWILYATQNSLGSQPCQEEYAYALDRALNSRGDEFPIIAVFPTAVDKGIIPAGIRTRLYISLQDQNWKERIVASVEKRNLNIGSTRIDPYEVLVKPYSDKGYKYLIEIRPRAGSWSPFFAGISINEKDTVQMHLMHGPRGNIKVSGVLFGATSGASKNDMYWVSGANNEATPSQSYGLFVKELPSYIIFGVLNGDPQYVVEFSGNRPEVSI